MYDTACLSKKHSNKINILAAVLQVKMLSVDGYNYDPIRSIILLHHKMNVQK